MEKKDLKIVFFGTPEFAVESLRRIHDEGFNVVAVVTMPDKPAGRGKHLTCSPVKEYALEVGLPILQPVSLKDPQFVDELRRLDADLFIVIAFRMLPEVVWQMPPLGTFNLHASLLPRYRGAAPINWAVINGDTTTGVTTFFLKHEIDTGDIIRQERIDILPTDNVGTVYDRLMTLGTELTIDTINHILIGDLTPVPQSQIADVEPCPAPKIFKDTCRIDWTKTAVEVHNLVRGLSPYPAAWSDLMGTGDTYKIYATQIVDETPKSAPATVEIRDGRLFVDCADARIEILEIQAPGKRRMPTPDFLRGFRP